MKKIWKFHNPEVQANVPSQASASETRDCTIFTNWLLCCAVSGGGLRASSAGQGGGGSLLPAPWPGVLAGGCLLPTLWRWGEAGALCLPPTGTMSRAGPGGAIPRSLLIRYFVVRGSSLRTKVRLIFLCGLYMDKDLNVDNTWTYGL